MFETMKGVLLDNPLFYLFIIAGIFAIGDILGVVTKAKLSSVFVALILFLVGFLTGVIPPDVVEKAGLVPFASMTASLVIFHMGTMIDLKQLLAEWRTVVTAALSMAVVWVVVFAISPIIGKENAIVAAPILNGGLIATKIMTEGAEAVGLSLAAALGLILYATQKFAGSYPASMFGVKEAKVIVEEYRRDKQMRVAQKADETVEAVALKTFAEKNGKYFTDFVCFGIATLFGVISTTLGKMTPVNYSIWALLTGATLSHFGLVPKRILEKGKASGLLSMLVFATIMPSLAKVTVNDLATLGLQTVVILAATLVGLFLVFYILPGWKLVKSKNLALGIAMGQLLGFPATFLIANEVAKAVTDDAEEQEVILERIMPAYVVAGITTVTVLSVVVAGVFVKFL